jgi:hypothetical protein
MYQRGRLVMVTSHGVPTMRVTLAFSTERPRHAELGESEVAMLVFSGTHRMHAARATSTVTIMIVDPESHIQ